MSADETIELFNEYFKIKESKDKDALNRFCLFNMKNNNVVMSFICKSELKGEMKIDDECK